MADAITGFEGIVDTLSLSLQRQQQRAARQAQLLQLPGAERGIETLSDTLGALFQAFSPDAPQRRAQAVDTARANARARVQGQEFDSPIEQRMALVRTAAEELREQGMFAEADRLDANADLMYQQSLELKELSGKVTDRQLEIDRKLAEKPFWAANFANVAKLNQVQAEAALVSLEEQIAGIDDRLATLKAERTTSEGRAANVGLERQRLLADLEDKRASAELARFSLAAARNGTRDTITVEGQGVFDAMIQPDGTAVYQDKSGQVRRVPVGLYASGNLTGGTTDIASPNSPAGQALAQQTEVANLIDLFGRLKRSTIVNPGTRTISAQGAAIIDQVRAQATMVRGGLSAQQRAADDALLEDVFRQYNIADATQKSLITSAAYAIARVREPSAPALSIGDIKGAAESLGGSNPSDAALRAVLDEQAGLLWRAMERRSEQAGRPVPQVLRDQFKSYQELGRPAPTPTRTNPNGAGAARRGPPVPRPAGASSILGVESRN